MEKKHQQEEYVDFVVTARKYKTLLTAKYKSRPMWHKPSAGDVVSHLPGTIIKIMVEEGQAVEAGQLLLIHEAMKMQNRVVAPISGVVVELNVKEGDKINIVVPTGNFGNILAAYYGGKKWGYL